LSVEEKIRFEELRPHLWYAIERLFGPNGACDGCWCMWWRKETSEPWKQFKGARAKETFKNLVQVGKAHGILAFVGDEPVGWCSFGPRQDFPSLEKVRAYKRDDTANVWSINCFFIHRRWRRKGLTRGLLSTVVEAIKKRGVKVIEAYPVTTTKDGRRLGAMMAWTGPLKIFEELGFKTVQATNPFKPLVRLELKK